MIGSPCFGQACDNYFDNCFEVGESLLGCPTPGRASPLDERRAIGMPAIIVRFDNDFEGVGGHPTLSFATPNRNTSRLYLHFTTILGRSQNGIQEKLTKIWVDRCLQHLCERPAMAAE
jgi:hypothetical protein